MASPRNENLDEKDAGPRKRGRPPGNRRDKILREAARLFYERGFYATSTDDIGEAAGISGPALYRHFASKDEILLTLVNDSADRSEGDIAGIHAAGGTPREMLERLVRVQTRQSIEQAHLIAFTSQSIASLRPADRQRIVRRERMNREEWVHIVSQVRRDLSEAEVRALVIGLKHMTAGLVNTRTGLSPEEIERLTNDTVLGAIYAPRPDATTPDHSIARIVAREKD